jgi:hydroxymethylbilane synthase
LQYRADFKIRPLRGNVDTRLRKVKEGEYDAILLASAGLNRLGWANLITEEISHKILLPAMGQGALGIETRLEDTKIYDLISSLNHEETHYAVSAERALVTKLNGGCQVPIGAYAIIEDGLIILKGLVASLDGKTIYKSEKIGPIDDAINVGQELGNELLKMGANYILENLS